MEFDRFQKIQQLFDQVVVQPENERMEFLRGACGEDTDLHRKVEALLEADFEAETFIALPDAATEDNPQTSELAGPRILEEPGSMIGRYKLLQLIGEGGFGSVYMAEQRSPVVRKVALKIIKLGMDTKQVIGRFEAERQALAMMDHPNIARVLDAGTTDTGRPYFVMELVRGIPITEFCNTHNQSLTQRLELFMQVCFAVQHAHQKGIIHRDLKPNNVLVTMADNNPMPKVIDFGIAKAMTHRLTDRTLFTEFRQFIGTPEYMSPEQAQPAGIDIDTRSDIYALGVLLYELLTGTTPFDPKRLRSAAMNEVQRIIKEEEPRKPSTRLDEMDRTTRVSTVSEKKKTEKAESASIASSLMNIAQQRGTDPGSLKKTLKGDLDWIVMKALEKDRTRRYETAYTFAMDVQRFLNVEPVLASPPSATYKINKMMKRNRGPVLAAFLILAVLIIGIIGTTTAMIKAKDSQRTADIESTRATTALTRLKTTASELEASLRVKEIQSEELARQVEMTEAVNEFMSDFLTAPASDKSGADVKLIDVLNDAASRVSDRFSDYPMQEAMAREMLGRVYTSQALPPKAAEQYDRIVKIYKKELGPDDPKTLVASSLLLFAHAHYGLNQQIREEAQAILPRSRSILGEHSTYTLTTRRILALQDVQIGKFKESESELRSLIKDAEEVLGSNDNVTINSMLCLVRVLRKRAEKDITANIDAIVVENIEILTDVLQRQEATEGTSVLATVSALQLMSEVYSDAGRHLEAIEAARETLRVSEGHLQDHHWLRRSARETLALLEYARGDVDAAAEYASKALESVVEIFGLDQPATIIAMREMLPMLIESGRYEESLKYTTVMVATMTRHFGQSNESTLSAKIAHARCLAGVERFVEADPLFQEAIWYEVHLPTTMKVDLHHNYGDALTDNGDYEQAEIELQKALELSKHPESIHIGGLKIRILKSTLELYEMWDKPQKAAAILNEIDNLSRDK